MAKILIIEDDKEISALEQDYLVINGFETKIASGGVEGLNHALTGEFDLIVLDIMLPEMDGFSVLKKLRETSDVPVILLSARGEDIDKIRGLGLGADDYISKPFSPGELVARVKAHLARFERLTSKNEKSRVVFDIRGLKVDKSDRRVTLHSEEKTLTPKEFDLLLFFIEHPNRVFDKESLFEHVWGLESFGDSGTVVVHIKKLREKIESDPSSPQFLETIWGAGYRFRV